ncbi:siderophore-interacting protein [Phenylobacterium sp.]|uniref:siderophore-interacting protein n=1 Tax=Phenylobacterium sp. TaxID=1871053 RepID=UPI00272339C8|nr:siderophore-interacting protein [Phenylobacterium sp.]MDO8377718.1 siderophore-interacting protein [Phenylobacterium sp.]
MTDTFTATRPLRPPMPLWPLTVVEARDLTPHMRRITFSTEDLTRFDHRPGQDLVLMMTDDDGQPGRRHYTIRSADKPAGRLDIDFVLHGHGGPAERWALAAKPCDQLEARGPRGHTMINPAADWHVFVGDETCLPGIFAMIESLPARAKAFAFIEVAEKADQQTLNAVCDVELEWLVRGGPAVPGSPRLIDRLALFAPRPGRGHAYVIGETSTVRAQRQGLLARGFAKDQISAEGYWRPGRQGGHDHIRDEAEMAARMRG